eukprot:5712941-Amphidinium_carterae.4
MNLVSSSVKKPKATQEQSQTRTKRQSKRSKQPKTPNHKGKAKRDKYLCNPVDCTAVPKGSSSSPKSQYSSLLPPRALKKSGIDVQDTSKEDLHSRHLSPDSTYVPMICIALPLISVKRH